MRRRALFSDHSGDQKAAGTIKLLIKDFKGLLHDLTMRLKAGVLTIGMMPQVKLTLTYMGGATDVVIDCTAQELDELVKRYGGTAYATNSVLTIPFKLFKMLGVVETYSTSLNFLTKSKASGKMIKSALLEITYTGANDPEVEFIGDIDDASADGPGAIMRIKRFDTDTMPVSAVPDRAYKDLPSGADSRLYLALLLKPAAGSISVAKINFTSGDYFYSNKVIEDQLAVESERVLGGYWDHVIDFMINGISEPLDTGVYGKPQLLVAQSGDAGAPVNIEGLLVTIGQ